VGLLFKGHLNVTFEKSPTELIKKDIELILP